MEPRIRLLEHRDLPELVELCREHAEYERSPWRTFERQNKLAQMWIDQADARCWVVQHGDQLAGFASACLERSTWDAGRFLHMDCLYLRPAYRAQGLGRRLMLVVASAAREWGALNLQWQTPHWNRDAIRFYERLGAGSSEKLRYTMAPEQMDLLLDTEGPGTVDDTQR